MSLEDTMSMKVVDPQKMSNYAYFIIRRSSDRFLLQGMLQTLIKDFKSKSKEFDKIHQKLHPKRNTKLGNSSNIKDESEGGDFNLIGSAILYTANERQMLEKVNKLKNNQNYPEPSKFLQTTQIQPQTNKPPSNPSQLNLTTPPEESDPKYIKWLLLSEEITKVATSKPSPLPQNPSKTPIHSNPHIPLHKEYYGDSSSLSDPDPEETKGMSRRKEWKWVPLAVQKKRKIEKRKAKREKEKGKNRKEDTAKNATVKGDEEFEVVENEDGVVGEIYYDVDDAWIKMDEDYVFNQQNNKVAASKRDITNMIMNNKFVFDDNALRFQENESDYDFEGEGESELSSEVEEIYDIHKRYDSDSIDAHSTPESRTNTRRPFVANVETDLVRKRGTTSSRETLINAEEVQRKLAKGKCGDCTCRIF